MVPHLKAMKRILIKICLLAVIKGNYGNSYPGSVYPTLTEGRQSGTLEATASERSEQELYDGVAASKGSRTNDNLDTSSKTQDVIPPNESDLGYASPPLPNGPNPSLPTLNRILCPLGFCKPGGEARKSVISFPKNICLLNECDENYKLKKCPDICKRSKNEFSAKICKNIGCGLEDLQQLQQNHKQRKEQLKRQQQLPQQKDEIPKTAVPEVVCPEKVCPEIVCPEIVCPERELPQPANHAVCPERELPQPANHVVCPERELPQPANHVVCPERELPQPANHVVCPEKVCPEIVCPERELPQPANRVVCPQIVWPQIVCPEKVCPEKVCPEKVCPEKVCPGRELPQPANHVVCPERELSQTANRVVCPQIVWPQIVCPEIVWPEIVCPEKVCPENVCPERELPQPANDVACPEIVCPEKVCPEIVCPEIVCPEKVCPEKVCPEIVCPERELPQQANHVVCPNFCKYPNDDSIRNTCKVFKCMPEATNEETSKSDVFAKKPGQCPISCKSPKHEIFAKACIKIECFPEVKLIDSQNLEYNIKVEHSSSIQNASYNCPNSCKSPIDDLRTKLCQQIECLPSSSQEIPEEICPTKCEEDDDELAVMQCMLIGCKLLLPENYSPKMCPDVCDVTNDLPILQLCVSIHCKTSLPHPTTEDTTEAEIVESDTCPKKCELKFPKGDLRIKLCEWSECGAFIQQFNLDTSTNRKSSNINDQTPKEAMSQRKNSQRQVISLSGSLKYLFGK